MGKSLLYSCLKISKYWEAMNYGIILLKSGMDFNIWLELPMLIMTWI